MKNKTCLMTFKISAIKPAKYTRENRSNVNYKFIQLDNSKWIRICEVNTLFYYIRILQIRQIFLKTSVHFIKLFRCFALLYFDHINKSQHLSVISK